MNMKICAVSLSLLAGACALVYPAAAHAGNVGYYKMDGACPGYVGSASAAITAAGQTPIAVTTLDNPTLASLDGLVISIGCTTYSSNPAVNNAVANGMALVLDVGYGYSTPSTNLPGAPVFTSTFSCPTDIDIASGTPIASGPGGTLDNTSFDFTDGLCALVGYVQAPQLPAGAVPFLTIGGDPSSVSAFGYSHGNGRVAFSMSQISMQLPGNASGYNMSWAGAGSTYISNALAWALAAESQTTCASEGYKGAQLTWCKNICENGLTGQVLDTWIHRWINRYRDLPYCARETTPPPPPPAG